MKRFDSSPIAFDFDTDPDFDLDNFVHAITLQAFAKILTTNNGSYKKFWLWSDKSWRIPPHLHPKCIEQTKPPIDLAENIMKICRAGRS